MTQAKLLKRLEGKVFLDLSHRLFWNWSNNTVEILGWDGEDILFVTVGDVGLPDQLKKPSQQNSLIGIGVNTLPDLKQNFGILYTKAVELGW